MGSEPKVGSLPRSKSPSTPADPSQRLLADEATHPPTHQLWPEDKGPHPSTNYRGGSRGIRLFIMKFYQAISVHRLYFKPTFKKKKRRDRRGNLNIDELFHIKTSYFYDRYARYVFCKQNPHLLGLIMECSHNK